MQQAMVTLKRHNIQEILLSCTPSLAESYQRLEDSLSDSNQNSADDSEAVPQLNEEAHLANGESETGMNIQFLRVNGPTTGKTLQEDVSYMIIKTEGLDDFVERRKRRLNSQSRSIRMTTDGQPVNVNGPFECMHPSSFIPNGICHQIFFNCCEYSMHYREEHTKRRKAALRCQVCEKHLEPEVDLKADENRNVHPCHYCGKVFTDPDELSEHCRLLHVKLRPFQCQMCQKRFTQQGGLQQHMRMHTGDRPFPCNFCSKRFTQKSGLDQHLRIHTKVKPFHCVVCWKNFSQSVHLKQHMRTHTQIQPFECGVCSRRFKQTSHLNFHLKSHTPQEVSIHEAKMGTVMLDETDVPVQYLQIQ